MMMNKKYMWLSGLFQQKKKQIIITAKTEANFIR